MKSKFRPLHRPLKAKKACKILAYRPLYLINVPLSLPESNQILVDILNLNSFMNWLKSEHTRLYKHIINAQSELNDI